MKRVIVKAVENKIQFSPTISRRSALTEQLRSAIRWTLIGGLLFAPVGCSPDSKTKEVSAETSGFRPADSSQASTKSKPKSGDASSSTTEPSTAPQLPNFQPGQDDPSLQAKSYKTLKMTDSEKPEDIVKFLVTVDRAMMDLQNDANKKQINNDTILTSGMDLLRMKSAAADRLRNAAKTPDETAQGWISKLEALQQMAMFRDVPAQDDLRKLSGELSSNDDPRVSKIAQRLQLQLLSSDYANQTATVDQVLAAAKSLLDKAEGADPGVFMAVAQAAQALSSESDSAAASEPKDPASATEPKTPSPGDVACDQLVDALEAKFRDVPDPNLGMRSWQMKMRRLPDFESYLQVIDTRQALAADPVVLTEKAKDLMDKIPSPWTAMALSQCAMQFEFSGNIEVAKSLLDLAATQLEKTKTPELKSQIEMSVTGFQKRVGTIGKPLNLEGLVDVSGKPFDKSKYEGKVVLVDFWATWCGPCIAEIPNIQKVYDEKHAEGFEVISINLDEKRSDLDEFLAQNKTSWDVLVSNDPAKSGMDTAIAQELSIIAIPFTMLIGRDGNVAAVHVRGKAIEEKVQQLLSARP
ncbi:MAG: TlpA family protein disulfide reductase [Pirellula sp.]